MVDLECADPGARTPISVSKNTLYISALFVLIADTLVPFLGICTLKGVLKDYECFSYKHHNTTGNEAYARNDKMKTIHWVN